jgi:predicted CopG family antitoxin
MRKKCANLELPTKNIRISTEVYRDLSKLGTLEDTFDSVIRNLLANQENSGQRGGWIYG